jgi:hypothetical protein
LCCCFLSGLGLHTIAQSFRLEHIPNLPLTDFSSVPGLRNLHIDFCSDLSSINLSVVSIFLFLRVVSCCFFCYSVFGFRQSQLYFSNAFYYYIPTTCFGPYEPSSGGIYIYWLLYKELFFYNGSFVLVLFINYPFITAVVVIRATTVS